jgi:hypothetical protein
LTPLSQGAIATLTIAVLPPLSFWASCTFWFHLETQLYLSNCSYDHRKTRRDCIWGLWIQVSLLGYCSRFAHIGGKNRSHSGEALRNS